MQDKTGLLKIYKKIVNLNRKHIFLVITSTGLEATLMLIPPYLLMRLLDSLQEQANLENVLLMAIAIAGVAVSDYLVQMLLAYENTILSRRIYEYYQRECVTHLFQMDGTYLTEMDLGENMTLMLKDVEQIGFFASN